MTYISYITKRMLLLAAFAVPALAAGQNQPNAAALPDAPAAVVRLVDISSSQAQQTGSAPATDASATPQTSQTESPQERRERADRELKQQEKQRILGVVPLFNTSMNQNAAPLSVGQKFHLAFKSAVDPYQFLISGIDAGIGQANDSFPEYGQGAQGYGKRFGASYADTFDGIFWGNAVLPALLHEDPRYFRRGHGTFKRRLLYSVSTAVIAKGDNGKWGPNYGNVLGNIIAGGISNIYYPGSDRGVGLTFDRAFTVTAEGSVGAFLEEFWPDVTQWWARKQR